MAPGRDREARRRERAPEPSPARERAREDAPTALPRDPFGRREGRGSARLDFLFDARRPDPESGAPRSPHAVHVTPTPPAEPEPSLELPPLPTCADLTPPPFEPPPAPPAHAETPPPVEARQREETVEIEPQASRYAFAPPPHERSRGFKNPAIPTGLRAFVPPRFAGIVEAAAGIARSLVALLAKR